MERLNPAQRSAFLRVWAQLPPHLREIAFDLNDPGWDPSAIEQLGDVLCDFPDVVSTSTTDFGYCSLMLLLDALRNLGSERQRSGHFTAPWHKPYTGQRRGRDYLAAGLI